MNTLRNLVLSGLLFVASIPAFALNGTYTVGPSPTANYPTISAAVSALTFGGVTGPCVFNVEAGAYTATTWRASIPAILGASSTNTITFQAQAGPGTVTITMAGAAATNYIERFDNGCTYVTFKDLTFVNTSTSNGRVIEFVGTASNNTVTNCVLTSGVSSSTTQTNSPMAVVFGYNVTGTGNTVNNNTINNGNIGVHVYGASTSSMASDWNITGNTCNPSTSTYYAGVYAYNTNNLRIIGNSVTKSTGAGTFWGIYPNYCYGKLEIRNNTITANPGVTGTNYGILGSYLIGTNAVRQAITGNTINLNSTTGTQYGLGAQYSNYDSISNNTVTTLATTGTTYPVYNYNNVYSASAGNGIIVTGNNWDGTATGAGPFGYCGLMYSFNSKFENNQFRIRSAGGAMGSSYPYMVYYSDSMSFKGNTIYDSTTSGSHTMYLGYYNNFSNTQGGQYNVVSNNNIRLISNSSSIAYYQCYYNQNRFVDNNTIYLKAGSSISPLYITYYNYLGTMGSVSNNNVYAYAGTSIGTFSLAYYAFQGDVNNNTVNVTAANGAISTMYINMYGANSTMNNNTMNFNATTSIGTTYNGYGAETYQIKNNVYNFNFVSGSLTHYLPYTYWATQGTPVLVDNNKYNFTTTSGNIQNTMYDISYHVMQFSNNVINATSGTGTVYGLYHYAPNGKFFNNVITTKTSGANYTWYVPATAYANSDFYNNTINNQSVSTGTNYTLYALNTYTNGPIVNFRNNIIYKASANGTAPAIQWVDASYQGDYNNIYNANTSVPLASISGTNYNTIASLRATGRERNSLTFNPGLNADGTPDPTNSNSWSIQGRGVQIPGNSTDVAGNPRAVITATGVPDLGAYEFTPTATAPLCTAIPAAAVAGQDQTLTFGQDTVAVISWAPTSAVPAAGQLFAKQYTGVMPPAGFTTFNATAMYMYDSIDVNTAGAYNYSIKNYFKDPWLGTIATKTILHLAKKDITGSGPWTGYPYTISSPNTTRNFINTIPTPTGFSNFGYFTGMDIGNNAGVSNVAAAPTGTYCPGTYTVKVNVLNLGNNVINGVQLFWQVNGLPVTPNQINVTTPIGVNTGVPGSNQVTVTLGNISFGNTTVLVKAWTSLPNASADPVSVDDTAYIPMHAALSGVYTIGGTTPDYTTVTSAVSDLNTYGVCGPVTFNIRPGTYNGRLALTTASGMSSTNRVTFKSENGVASSVTIGYTSAAQADQSTIFLNNASYYSFKDLTVVNSATGSYCMGFEFRTNPTKDSITGCTISVNTNTGSSYVSPIYGYSGNLSGPCDGTVIQNNTMTGGYWFTFYGSSSAPLTNLVIENNTYTGSWFYGLYVSYTSGARINNNTITTTYATPSYGLLMQYDYKSPIITNNKINFPGGYACYLIYISGINPTSNRATIKNNVFRVGTSGNYAAYLWYFNNTDFINNTCLNYGTSSGYH